MNAKRLRTSMVVGATYDLLVGATIVVALEPLSKLLPIPFPTEPFYARMQGVLLIGLGVFYAFAAHDLERNLRNVAGAIVIRLLGGAYLHASVVCADVAPFFHVFAAVDVALGLVHLWLLRTERRARFWPLLLRGEA